MRPRAVPAPIVAFCLAGCLTENHGMLAASKKGDTSNLAARIPPGAGWDRVCVRDERLGLGAAIVVRPPYLQLVDAATATVVWTSASPQPAGVELTRADDQPVGSFLAQVDVDAQPAGARQLFTRLHDLSPETIYCYALRQFGQPATKPAGLRTAPPAGSTTPVRFVVMGDEGGGNADQVAVAAQIETVDLDLVLTVGDNAYEHGTRDELERNFFAVYQGLQRRVPIFPTSGNHEYDTDDAAPFREVFMLPENGGPAGRERWYSFDWGQVHFVALDTEKVNDEQAAWLENDLAGTQRPWKVVYGHRPPYSSGEHGSHAQLRDFFAPIFEQYGVQLVLSGHDHDYERTTPQNGIVYVVSGGGGRSTRAVGVSSFTAFSLAVLHFLYVEVEATRMVLHAIDGTGVEFDSVVIPPVRPR